MSTDTDLTPGEYQLQATLDLLGAESIDEIDPDDLDILERDEDEVARYVADRMLSAGPIDFLQRLLGVAARSAEASMELGDPPTGGILTGMARGAAGRPQPVRSFLAALDALAHAAARGELMVVGEVEVTNLATGSPEWHLMGGLIIDDLIAELEGHLPGAGERVVIRSCALRYLLAHAGATGAGEGRS